MTPRAGLTRAHSALQPAARSLCLAAAAAAATAAAAQGRVRCPSHSHCKNSQCPELLEQSFSYHWDSAFVAQIVADNAACKCDTGYASASGCIGACAVHGEVRVRGQCTQVLRLTAADVVGSGGELSKGCDAGPLRACRVSHGVTDAHLDSLRARWTQWQPWSQWWPSNSSWPAPQQLNSGVVTDKDKLCFDLKKALTQQILCECDACDQEPGVDTFDLLGDGTCVFEGRGCHAGELTLNVGLGTAFGILGLIGGLGLWALKMKKLSDKKRAAKLAKERWKGAIARQQGGGMLGLIRAGLAREKALRAAEEAMQDGSDGGSNAPKLSASPAPSSTAGLSFMDRIRELKEKEQKQQTGQEDGGNDSSTKLMEEGKTGATAPNSSSSGVGGNSMMAMLRSKPKSPSTLDAAAIAPANKSLKTGLKEMQGGARTSPVAQNVSKHALLQSAKMPREEAKLPARWRQQQGQMSQLPSAAPAAPAVSSRASSAAGAGAGAGAGAADGAADGGGSGTIQSVADESDSDSEIHRIRRRIQELEAKEARRIGTDVVHDVDAGINMPHSEQRWQEEQEWREQEEQEQQHIITRQASADSKRKKKNFLQSMLDGGRFTVGVR